MISLDDCIGFSGYSAEQVDLIAHRMHLHPVIASEWLEAVLEQPGGQILVDSFLAEDCHFRNLTAAGQFANECLRLLRTEVTH